MVPLDGNRTPAPEGLRPMSATLATAPPTGAGWAFELKWDGIRALAYLDGERVRLFTRTGNDVTHRYPELGGLGSALSPRDAVLDGEIVALDDDGRPSFELLQQRMHVENGSAIRRLEKEVPVIYMAFDLLWLDGVSLLERSYDERREQLLALELSAASWQVPPHEVGDGSATLEISQRFGLEGVVAKRRDSPYEPGRRTRTWLKLKHTTEQEFVVGGWMPGERGRTGTVGSLLIGYYEDLGTEDADIEDADIEASGDVRTLRYAARVGSGLRARDLDFLDRFVAEHARATSPFAAGTPPKTARFLEPVLVVQVKFREWTNSGGVRAPVFMGYRDDIDPASVVRELPA
jgi:bifunctional non-homologous end joining protein LigD